MEITDAQDSHIPEIVRLWVEFEDYHGALDPVFSGGKELEEGFEQHLRKQMAREDGIVLVAVEAGKAIAYAMAWVEESLPVMKHRHYGYISDLAVTASHRRKGIGSEMLKRMLDWFDGRGIKRIHLGVAQANETALAFWRSHGFKTFTHILYIERP